MSAQHDSGYHMKFTVKLSEETPSCVRRLIQYVPGTLVNVAPEKFNKLVQTLGKGDLELEMIESPDLVHEFQPKGKRIRLSTRPLELLWAQSYAYFVWYSEVLANVQPSGQQIDPHRKPEVHRALKLLRWATEETVRPHHQPWPGNAPSPEPEPVNQSYAHVAQSFPFLPLGSSCTTNWCTVDFNTGQSETSTKKGKPTTEPSTGSLMGSTPMPLSSRKGRWVRQSPCSTLSLTESTRGNTAGSHIPKTTTV